MATKGANDKSGQILGALRAMGGQVQGVLWRWVDLHQGPGILHTTMGWLSWPRSLKPVFGTQNKRPGRGRMLAINVRKLIS